MSTIKFTPTGFEKWVSGLSPRLEEAIVRGMRSGAMRALPVLHEATRTAPPASPNGATGAVNTGEYLRSWKTEAVTDGVRVFNSHPASPVIEHGRRAGARMPPPRALEGWLRRRAGLPQAEARAAAFAVAKAIAERGLKGRKILTNAIPKIVEVMQKEVQHEIDREFSK